MSKNIVEAKHLVKNFGEIKAVDNISFSILEGEIFGLLGPNGAGKTTTISMMCGIVKPDGGHIRVDERKIGVCPQKLVLWGKLTCMEQLIFMGEMYGMSGKKAGEQGAFLLDKLGLTEKRDKQAETLSGGMQRRLNVAMALVHDPEIIIFDEPEAGLDPQSRVLVREFIRSLTGEKTVILTTHNMDEADRLAERIAIIDNGKLLVIDTPVNLKNSVGLGDVLEFSLDREYPQEIIVSLEKEIPELSIKYSPHRLMVRGETLLEQIQVIRGTLDTKDIRYSEMRIRETTLEDVFITLTGHGLRE